jgi:hypothetical protein
MSKNDLDRLNQILPAFYVLASSDWAATRNYIHERLEEGEVWANVLDENGLSVDDFDLYESWWNSPTGYAVIAELKELFIESIEYSASIKIFNTLNDFLRNHAVWEDFIRELSQCTPADGELRGGVQSYFAEYAVAGGLCYSISDDSEFDLEMITEVIETWFNGYYDQSQSILLSAYDEIAKVGLLKQP